MRLLGLRAKSLLAQKQRRTTAPKFAPLVVVMERMRRDEEMTKYWQSCNTKNLSDEELAKLLKPSFDLRNKPPVPGLGDSLQHRVFNLMSWGDRLEEETYYRLLKEYSYEEKLTTYYYTGTPPNRHRHSFVCGPKKWKGKDKDEKRIITEEMRTWQPTNLQDPDLESDSVWFNPFAVFGPDQEADSMLGPTADSHSDDLRTKKVTFDIDIKCIGDEGKVDRPQGRTYAANDVRNPNYNNQSAMPVSSSRSEPLTPGILPKGFF